MELAELVREAEIKGEALKVELEQIINSYNFRKQTYVPEWLISAKCARYMGAACKILNIDTAYEIGTRYGVTTIGISLGAKKVVTHDIDISNIVNEQLFADRNIIAIKLENEQSYLDIDFNKTKFLFVDIGEHTGEEESLLHKQLLKIGYKGIVFWDDVGPEWGNMLQFFDSIEQNKILLPTWHSSGFGVVEYD